MRHAGTVGLRRVWAGVRQAQPAARESPIFRYIDSLSPRTTSTPFACTPPADLTAEFDALLREAWAVGEQKHLA